MNNLRVAIVDDDDETLDLIEQILKEEDLKAQRFHRAEELLECLPDQSFDTIISDLVLPGKSGLELLIEIHRRGLSIPFVLITGYASLDSAIEAVNHGASYYIKKPFNIEEIRIAVQGVRQRQNLLHEIEALRQRVAALEQAPQPATRDNDDDTVQTLQHGPFDLSRIFATIEHMSQLRTSGLISDEAYGDFKGKILKRIV